MAELLKAQSIADYKHHNNLSRIVTYISKGEEKEYAVGSDGEFIGMLAEDVDKKKPLFVIRVKDKKGREWNFIGNMNERKEHDELH